MNPHLYNGVFGYMLLLEVAAQQFFVGRMQFVLPVVLAPAPLERLAA